MKTNTAQNLIETKQPAKSGFFGSSYDLFQFLRKPTISPEEQERERAKELLRTAYRKLESAERDIHEKTQRINFLESLLTTDELTEINNIRGFHNTLKKEIDYSHQNTTSGGVILIISMDHVDMIYSMFGIGAGNKAIQTISEYLKSIVRNMDKIARIAEDEFALLLVDTSISKSMKRVQLIEKELNNLNFQWDNTEIQIQASVSLQEYKSEDTVDDIIGNLSKNQALKPPANKKVTQMLTKH